MDEIDKNLKKADDEQLWTWWRNYTAMAMTCKKELDRRQNAPRLRIVKSRYSRPEPKIT